MREIAGALAGGFAGATIVGAMFWLEESVLPEATIYLPLAVGRLLIMGTVVAAVWLVVRRRATFIAGMTLAGASLAWALHGARPLALCQSGMLFRPCTSSEVAWMVVPPILLVILGGAIAAVALRQTRSQVRPERP